MTAQDWRIWLGVLAIFLFMVFGFPRQAWRYVFALTPPPVQEAAEQVRISQTQEPRVSVEAQEAAHASYDQAAEPNTQERDERLSREIYEEYCAKARAGVVSMDEGVGKSKGKKRLENPEEAAERCSYGDELYQYRWWNNYGWLSATAAIYRHRCPEIGLYENVYDCFIPPYPYANWKLVRSVKAVAWSPLTWLAAVGLIGTILWRPVLFPAFVRWRQKRLEPQPAQVGAGGTNITIRQARPLSEWFKAAYWIGRLVLLAIPTLWILGHMDGALDLLTVFVPEDMRPAFARWLQGLAGKIEQGPQ